MRALNGIIKALAETAAAPTVAEHLRAFIDREVDARYRAAGVATALGAEEFAAHQAHLPSHAHVRVAVIGRCADRARAMRAVPVIVHRIAVVIDDVDAVHVVHKPVVVIVHTVVGNLIGIHPHLVSQLLMRVTNARIDHRHQDIS